MMEPVYLGDGVYAQDLIDERGMLKLYTSNGVHETNVIWLDAHVAQVLFNFLKPRT